MINRDKLVKLPKKSFKVWKLWNFLLINWKAPLIFNALRDKNKRAGVVANLLKRVTRLPGFDEFSLSYFGSRDSTCYALKPTSDIFSSPGQIWQVYIYRGVCCSGMFISIHIYDKTAAYIIITKSIRGILQKQINL